MSDRVALRRTTAFSRIAIAGLAAAFLGGCSADALRFDGLANSLSNPFSSLRGEATGSVGSAVTASRMRGEALSAGKSNFAAAAAASPTVSGSLQRFQPPVTGGAAGWSAAGGTPLVVANGETASVLSQRYGVPEAALLSANGLSSSSQVAPGTRIMIPVYNAGAARAGATAPTASVKPTVPAAPAPPVAARPTAPAPAKIEASKPDADVARHIAEAKAAKERAEDDRQRLVKAREEARQAQLKLEQEKKKAALDSKSRTDATKVAARKEELARLEAKAKETKAAEAEQRKRAEERQREKKALEAKLAKLKAEEAKSEKAAQAQAKAQAQAEAKAQAKSSAKSPAKAPLKPQASAMAGKTASAKESGLKEQSLKDRHGKELALAKTHEPKDAPKASAKTAQAERASEPKPARAERIAAAEPAKSESAKSESAKAETAKADAGKAETTASLKAEETTSAASSGGNPEFRWPARGRVIQGFRVNGSDGINIAVPEGTPVKAAEGGVVAYAGSELKNLGNLVLIRHPNGYVSAYAHNGELNVKRGEQVKRGQTIAKSGQSGSVQSPQLHFELRKGSTPVDPTQYLAGL